MLLPTASMALPTALPVSVTPVLTTAPVTEMTAPAAAPTTEVTAQPPKPRLSATNSAVPGRHGSLTALHLAASGHTHSVFIQASWFGAPIGVSAVRLSLDTTNAHGRLRRRKRLAEVVNLHRQSCR